MRLLSQEIERLIDEDLRYGDLTTRLLGIGQIPGRMTFTARDGLLACGTEEAQRIFGLLGVNVTYAVGDGERLSKGAMMLLEAKGPAGALHAGWKVVQTLMEWASGVATKTAEIVAAAKAKAPHVQVLCTRKSVPFTRPLSLKAVMVGGAEVHRVGLSDTVMIFPEHLAFFPGLGDLRTAIAQVKAALPERAVMVEVKTEREAAAAAMADVVQLEKFSVEAVRRVVNVVRKRPDGRPIIAAAGGITAQNAGDYAEAGADTLVTSAPFYAKPLDIQVAIGPSLPASSETREETAADVE